MSKLQRTFIQYLNEEAELNKLSTTAKYNITINSTNPDYPSQDELVDEFISEIEQKISDTFDDKFGYNFRSINLDSGEDATIEWYNTDDVKSEFKVEFEPAEGTWKYDSKDDETPDTFVTRVVFEFGA